MPGFLDDGFAASFGGVKAPPESAPIQGAAPDAPPTITPTPPAAAVPIPPSSTGPAQAQPQAPAQQAQQSPQAPSPDGPIVDSQFQSMFGAPAAQGQPGYKPPPGLSPSNPIQDSQVSLMDRVKLDAGNVRGGLNYLKSKFDDAAYDEKVGLSVKKGGLWHAVDPHSDPWAVSAELGKDIADGAIKVVGPTIAQGIGSAVGGVAGAVAGPAGAAAGAVAGSGAAARLYEMGRHTLGKAWGTYQATPEEETKDLNIETLLGMGGEVVALGARPMMSALGNLSKGAWKYASDGAKSMAAEVFGKTTQAGAPAIRTLLDNSGEVVKTISKAVGEAGDVATAQDALKAQVVDHAETLLEKADAGLVNKYGSMLKDLITKAGKVQVKGEGDAAWKMAKAVSVDIGDVVGKSINSLEESGFGKFVDGKLVPLTDTDIARRLQIGLPVVPVDKAAFRDVASVAESIGKFNKVGKLEGEQAASVLTNVNKSLNSASRSIEKRMNVAPEAKQALGQINASFKTALGGEFDRMGLAKEYNAMQGLYQTYGDAVKSARKIMSSDSGKAIETFVNQLTSPGGMNSVTKQINNQLVELAGKDGQELARQIMIKDAAKNLAPWVPKMGLLQAATAGGGIVGAAVKGVAHINPVAAAATAVGATAFSPRAVANGANMVAGALHAADNGVMMATKARDFMWQLTPQARIGMLKDPNATGEFFRSVLNAYGNIDATKNQLLQQSGVVPPPQQAPSQ